MTQLLTPVGRMVQGSAFEPQTKDKEGRPLQNKDGSPRVSYFIAIAIPKNDPAWAAFHQAAAQVAQAAFPGGEWNLPTFAWKIADGDAPENQGKDGFAGHWIVRCAGGFPPKVYVQAGGQYAQVTDPNELKRGYYIRLQVTINGNKSTSKPGLFFNPGMIERIGFGEEIIGGPSADDVFGQAPVAQLPPGASATPLAPAVAPPGAVAPAPVAAAPVPAPVVAAPVTPAPVAVPMTPAAPPVPPVPQAAVEPVKTMTEKAAGATYEQMLTAGWTDETLIQHGYMLNTAPGVQPNPAVLNG